MAKKKRKKSNITNPILVALMARYGRTTSTMGSRNQRRRNRRSWAKDEEKAWG
jgi:hypothetical protein